MKNRTTFEKFPRTNAGRSKNWKTLRALCLLLFLSVSFTAYSQITVNVKDISLRASLKKIEQVSNYKFFYNENLPELNQKVSLNVTECNDSAGHEATSRQNGTHLQTGARKYHRFDS